MKNKGFTLIEVIMVIVVIGMSSLGLVVVMQQTLINIHKPRITQTAAFLAEQKMECILHTGFSGLDFNPCSYPLGISGYTYSATVTNCETDLDCLSKCGICASGVKSVIVSVTHQALGPNRAVRLPLLKTNY